MVANEKIAVGYVSLEEYTQTGEPSSSLFGVCLFQKITLKIKDEDTVVYQGGTSTLPMSISITPGESGYVMAIVVGG